MASAEVRKAQEAYPFRRDYYMATKELSPVAAAAAEEKAKLKEEKKKFLFHQ